MRRTLSTIVLALGLVFTAVPAWAGDPSAPPVPVAPKFTDPTCDPAITEAFHQMALAEDALRAARETVVAQGETINAQQGKIDRQRQTIRRLRAQLRHH